MKLKDIETGGYYWTRGTRYANTIPVRVIAIIEVPICSGWERLVTGSVKKVQVHRLHLGDDGCLAAGGVEELMPGMIVCPADYERVLARLVAAKAASDSNRENHRLAKEYAPAMIEALEAAGFVGATHGHGGLIFGPAAIAVWAEASFFGGG